jgi:4-hydroxy-3-polyprenylbenzoate decarboxylase
MPQPNTAEDPARENADLARRRQVTDLRSALRLLEDTPGQLLRTDAEVDPAAELAGVYRRVGAGAPVEPPTRIGPAMLFQNVKGYPGARIVAGVMASRERVGLLLDSPPEQLGECLLEAYRARIAPAEFGPGTPPCQEVVHLPPLDIRKLLPAPTNTPLDAGPYFTMGLLRATDPETGEHDVTIHRLCVQSEDTISIFFAPGRHIDVFRQKAEAMGRALPVSIGIGLDPAVYIAACFEAPTTPQGLDELSIAGGLRGEPVRLAPCVSIPESAIATAEVVIEGEILPGVRVREDQNTNTGHAMPEFPGYNGPANPSLALLRVTAITHRRNPILQTIVGPGEEHVNLAGIPTEASIQRAVEEAMPGRLKNVYAHSAGGGKLLAILQFRKSEPSDQGRQRQAALIALAVYSELKHVILVDDDVDIFDSNEVLWAMTTRYQGDVSTIFIPGVIGHVLDPSQSPDFSAGLPRQGTSCKTIFDCTVPYALKDKFVRAKFQDIPDAELERFLRPSSAPLDL